MGSSKLGLGRYWVSGQRALLAMIPAMLLALLYGIVRFLLNLLIQRQKAEANLRIGVLALRQQLRVLEGQVRRVSSRVTWSAWMWSVPVVSTRRARLIDHPHLEKVEELVERSRARIRADVVHDRLRAMGFAGNERTTRRAVAAAKAAYRAGRRRSYRPWLPEPGAWLHFDWGDGPRVGGRRTNLFCAWLAWSRYRVVVPTWDRKLGALLACVDATLRRLGGAPTYLLTDNERTVTTDHVAGVPVRHPVLVAAGRHYGLEVQTCVVPDPETKGGSEATVRVAKADLVPTEANLLEEYGSFDELKEACEKFCAEVNARPHTETRRPVG
jgi:transposase